MLQTITLRAGTSKSTSPVPLHLTPVTVFVGPNNSGKSRILSELAQICASGADNAASLLLSSVTFAPWQQAEIDNIVAAMRVPTAPGEVLTEGNVILRGQQSSRFQVPLRHFTDALLNPNQSQQYRNYACSWFLAFHTLKLDAVTRMTLVNEGAAGDLLASGTTPIQVLFRNDELRAKLRKKILDAFGLHFTVDPTNIPNLRIKLSEVPPPSSTVERGWTQTSVDFHSKAVDIQQFSDGVKAFTGMLMAVTAGNPYVILIDEPEAFLHPTLAFKLGKDIAETTVGSEKRLMAATHSPDFVMGCISSGAPINIVRLTYHYGTATARVLPSDKLLRLMRNPLLRSTGVLAGLFYEFVVVSEADSDRAFYQEINERLVRFGNNRGASNTLFLNAQNRQTVDQIIGPLRDLGIPAAAIVDIDVIKEGGVVFSRLLESAFVPDITKQSLSTARSQIHNVFKASGKDPVLNGGVSLLDQGGKAAARDFFDRLGEYGIFVVERGALENWLPQLGSGLYKDEWLPKVFELMGEDPTQPGYLKPTLDDVWEFIDKVAAWVKNSNKKGIPD